ncbi:hypothetical protein B0H17DRAFT_1092925 [Mycena rosella]|uniref:Uncharacterized protein n=1 Tax=Mycena rosella TaxID=1033263 RepID=A0AAD7CXD5_MYCRO|nr:hypothetical protein B0H17DRAFT_1092925 [Mycena rosella]
MRTQAGKKGKSCHLRSRKTCFNRRQMGKNWDGGILGENAEKRQKVLPVSGQRSGGGSVSLPVRPHVAVRGRRTIMSLALTSAGTFDSTSSARNSAVDSTLCSRGHAVVKKATKSASRGDGGGRTCSGVRPAGAQGRRSVGKGDVQLDERERVLDGLKIRYHRVLRVPRGIGRGAVDEDKVKGGNTGCEVADDGGDALGWDSVFLD